MLEDLCFSAVSYYRPAMRKNEPVYYSYFNAGLIDSMKTRFGNVSEEPDY